MYYKSLSEIVEKAKEIKNKSIMAVAAANDEHSIEASFMAFDSGIVDPILVGSKEKIKEIVKALGREIDDSHIVDAVDNVDAAKKAVALVKEAKANFLLKGKLDTKDLLKAVVDKENGLGLGNVMSHFSIFEIPGAKKLLVPVDGGMVTYPNLEQKKAIIDNTVSVLRAIGYDMPKVGVLSCVEKINPKMPETVEADLLKQMNQNGEIKNCIVEGPISYDCAVSSEICEIKGYESPCAGDCDILLAPNIHAGNIMGKMLAVTCHAKMAGIVVGAKCPIAMTSRGSSSEEKLNSIILAALVAANSEN